MRRFRYLLLAALLFAIVAMVWHHYSSVSLTQKQLPAQPPAATETVTPEGAPSFSRGLAGPDDLYPDPQKTFGHVDPNMTEEMACTPGLAQKDRIVNEAIRERVFEAYHIPPSERYDADGKPRFEIDHFVPVVLGGDSPNDGSVPITANLWPQPYFRHPGAYEKDTVEKYLHYQVCKSHMMTLKQAQEAIEGDWYKYYLEWQSKPHRRRSRRIVAPAQPAQ